MIFHKVKGEIKKFFKDVQIGELFYYKEGRQEYYAIKMREFIDDSEAIYNAFDITHNDMLFFRDEDEVIVKQYDLSIYE